jgi:hypothetical protein
MADLVRVDDLGQGVPHFYKRDLYASIGRGRPTGGPRAPEIQPLLSPGCSVRRSSRLARWAGLENCNGPTVLIRVGLNSLRSQFVRRNLWSKSDGASRFDPMLPWLRCPIAAWDHLFDMHPGKSGRCLAEGVRLPIIGIRRADCASLGLEDLAHVQALLRRDETSGLEPYVETCGRVGSPPVASRERLPGENEGVV